MARAVGKDVVLELMETTKRLERGFSAHAEQLDQMARIAMEMAARTTALEMRATQFEVRMNEMTVTVNQLGSTVNQLGSTVNQLGSTVSQLAATVNQLTANVNQLTGNVNVMGSELTRFTNEVGQLSADTTRFAELAVATARESLETRSDLARLTRLVGALAERNGSRLDDIEERVTKLEKKSA